jgi:hypothetical protein
MRHALGGGTSHVTDAHLSTQTPDVHTPFATDEHTAPSGSCEVEHWPSLHDLGEHGSVVWHLPTHGSTHLPAPSQRLLKSHTAPSAEKLTLHTPLAHEGAAQRGWCVRRSAASSLAQLRSSQAATHAPLPLHSRPSPHGVRADLGERLHTPNTQPVLV